MEGRSKHYTELEIQTIEVIKHNMLTYNEGNVLKCILRYRFKNNPLIDLQKADDYIGFMIKDKEWELSMTCKSNSRLYIPANYVITSNHLIGCEVTVVKAILEYRQKGDPLYTLVLAREELNTKINKYK